MKLKQKIYNHYLQVITDKIAMLQKVLNDLKESGANETKSTAGDKHETALAMLQIEQANTRAQLQEILNQQAAMQKINPSLSADIVLNGSLIKTNRGYFYMSVALGKADVDDISVIALSPQSPLGNRLMGLKAGATTAVNNTDYVIESIE
jgi:transcription elongation GreA/GreB family factor